MERRKSITENDLANIRKQLAKVIDSDGNTYAKSEQDRLQEEIYANLDRLGGSRVQDDTLTFEGDRFVLPGQLAGRIDDAIEYLETWRDSQREEYSYHRTFKYRPWDGAAAFERAMKAAFGSTGVGRKIYSMFGSSPPRFVSVEVGPNDTIQVPWGKVQFKPLEANFILDVEPHPELGVLFHLAVTAPRQHRQRIEAFFMLVQRELEERSIYKGKAITAAQQPGFINTNTVDPERVIYSDQVMNDLDANLWSLITHTKVMRDARLPLKRQVLLSGKWGTGKTLAGVLTAQLAEQNGWTSIQVRSGQDDLYQALGTAQLYAPAVVWYEDIDVVRADTDQEISTLLDRLDNVANKGVEVIAVFTTNHKERLHKGMLRPGRLDAVIDFGALDPGGFRRLVEAVVPDPMLSDDIDWDAVAAAMDGMVPAFAKEATDRALRYAIARTGNLPQEITTADLVNAAHGLRPQLELMDDARETGSPWTVDKAFTDLIDARIQAHKMTEWNEPFAKVGE